MPVIAQSIVLWVLYFMKLGTLLLEIVNFLCNHSKVKIFWSCHTIETEYKIRSKLKVLDREKIKNYRGNRNAVNYTTILQNNKILSAIFPIFSLTIISIFCFDPSTHSREIKSLINYQRLIRYFFWHWLLFPSNKSSAALIY